MTKNQTSGTLSAYSIALGASILEEEVAAAHEMQNYAFGQTPRVHACFACNLSSIPALDVQFPESTSFTERFRFRTYIDPDAVQILITLTATFTSTNDGEARVTIGSANTTITFTAGATSTNTGTLNTSSTGTGVQVITIELRQVGASQPTGQTLDRVSIQDQAVTSSLPDPDTSE